MLITKSIIQCFKKNIVAKISPKCLPINTLDTHTTARGALDGHRQDFYNSNYSENNITNPIIVNCIRYNNPMNIASHCRQFMENGIYCSKETCTDNKDNKPQEAKLKKNPSSLDYKLKRKYEPSLSSLKQAKASSCNCNDLNKKSMSDDRSFRLSYDNDQKLYKHNQFENTKCNTKVIASR